MERKYLAWEGELDQCYHGLFQLLRFLSSRLMFCSSN
jgi:hypothetical protein